MRILKIVKVWHRVCINIENQSFDLRNGRVSQRFYQPAAQLGQNFRNGNLPQTEQTPTGICNQEVVKRRQGTEDRKQIFSG